VILAYFFLLCNSFLFFYKKNKGLFCKKIVIQRKFGKMKYVFKKTFLTNERFFYNIAKERSMNNAEKKLFGLKRFFSLEIHKVFLCYNQKSI